jgi:hypothetical protein
VAAAATLAADRRRLMDIRLSEIVAEALSAERPYRAALADAA